MADVTKGMRVGGKGPVTGSEVREAGSNLVAGQVPGPGLSEADQRHLATFEAKLQVIREWVKAVAGGHITGLFVHGPPGISKSFTILSTPVLSATFSQLRGEVQ